MEDNHTAKEEIVGVLTLPMLEEELCIVPENYPTEPTYSKNVEEDENYDRAEEKPSGSLFTVDEILDILDDEEDSVLDKYIEREFWEHKLIVKSFLSRPRTKPMVIFCACPNARVISDIHPAVRGCSTPIDVQDISSLKSQPLLDAPQQVVEINYDLPDMDDCEALILLTELLAATGKHVILYCRCNEELSIKQNGSRHFLSYDNRVERFYDFWHKRTYMFVADPDNTFAKNQEIYHACCHNGYVDKILAAVKRNDEKLARNLWEDALKKRGTFSVNITETDNSICYHITSVDIYYSVKEQLEECGYKNVALKMQYEISKANGKILSCETFDLEGSPTKVI